MEKSIVTTRQKYTIFTTLVIVLMLIATAFIFVRQQTLVPVTGGNSAERAAPVKLSAPSSGPNPVYEYNLSRPPAFSSNKMTLSSGPNPVYEYNLSRPPASPSTGKTYIGGGFWLVTSPDGKTIIIR